MSQIGKILLWIALAGALVAVVAGFGVIQKRGQDAQVIIQEQANVASEHSNLVKANQATQAAQADEASTKTQLTEVQKKIDDLTSQLTDATKKQTDLQASIQAQTDAASKSQAEITRITSVLKGAAPEEVMAKIDKLNAQVAADNAQQKILEDQLQAATKQVADLKDAVNRAGQKAPPMPPGISGKVTFVNRTWNFVVLNVGLSNGVVPNGELIIYSGRNFLGKVKVTSAEDNTAVADILPGAKADIQVGDDVLN